MRSFSEPGVWFTLHLLTGEHIRFFLFYKLLHICVNILGRLKCYKKVFGGQVNGISSNYSPEGKYTSFRLFTAVLFTLTVLPGPVPSKLQSFLKKVPSYIPTTLQKYTKSKRRSIQGNCQLESHFFSLTLITVPLSSISVTHSSYLEIFGLSKFFMNYFHLVKSAIHLPYYSPYFPVKILLGKRSKKRTPLTDVPSDNQSYPLCFLSLTYLSPFVQSVCLELNPILSEFLENLVTFIPLVFCA